MLQLQRQYTSVTLAALMNGVLDNVAPSTFSVGDVFPITNGPLEVDAGSLCNGYNAGLSAVLSNMFNVLATQQSSIAQGALSSGGDAAAGSVDTSVLMEFANLYSSPSISGGFGLGFGMTIMCDTETVFQYGSGGGGGVGKMGDVYGVDFGGGGGGQDGSAVREVSHMHA
jgi:hypothetical protein